MSKLGGSIHFNRYGIFPFLTVLGSGLGRFVLVLMLRVWMGKPHRYMMFWAGWLDGNGWDCDGKLLCYLYVLYDGRTCFCC